MNTVNRNQSIQDGVRHLQAGRLQQAGAIFQQLCSDNPADADAWYLLGIIHGQTGRLQEAERCSRQAVAINPANSPAWDNLGLALLLQGRHQEARGAYQQSLHINPNNEKAYNALGSLHREQGQTREAISCFEKSIGINAKYAEPHNNLGNVYFKDLCQFDQAIASYRKALRINPRYVDACFNLGAVHEGLGDYQEALKYYRRALNLRPGTPAILAATASVHEKCREYGKAFDILKPLLDSNTIPASIALAFASIATKIDKTTDAIGHLEKALSDQTISTVNRQELLFKLGDLLDKTGEYDRAFASYQQANNLRPYPLDPVNMARQFEVLKSAFNADTMPLLPRAGNNTELPVFIVGMPRSGTTLIEQILASHPEVSGAGELPYMGEIVTSLQRRFNASKPYPDVVHDLGTKELDQLAETYLNKLSGHSSDAKRVTDKMPHNFLHLGLIDCMLPGARVIHCQRDPMDTCLSIYFHNFSANHPYASDLQQLGTYYNLYRDLMLHWRNVLRIPILDILYEELVADQEAVSRQIIDFCGLEWDERCLKYYESGRVVSTPSYNQVRQPMYAKSIHRWKNYEEYLGPLKSALQQ